MDLQPDKTDAIVKPITNTRISASEWNQLVGSCMAFITAAGFTPDAEDDQQFLNAFIQIAQNMGAIGANVDLSNLSATGEAHFDNTYAKTDLSNVTGQSGFRKLIEIYNNGQSWYKVYNEYNPSTGVFIGKWCEQGGYNSGGTSPVSVTLLKTMADTNYSIQLTRLAGSSTSNTTVRVVSGEVYVDSFKFAYEEGNGVTYWEAKGYCA